MPAAGSSREEITELVHAYSDAVIWRDADRWASCWAPDATWTLPGGRHAEGRDAIVELWCAAMSAYDVVIQHVHDGAVQLDGGRGRGRWHISESARRRDGRTAVLLAHYDDEYEHVDGSWRFASRSLEVHYHGPPDLSGAFTTTTRGGS